MSSIDRKSDYGLENHGIVNVHDEYWNLNTPCLYEMTILRGEGIVAHLGPIVVRTGARTGRSAEDKYIVEEPTSKDKIWWGKGNKPFPMEKFDALYYRILAYLQNKAVFVQDCFVGADPEYRIPLRIITEDAWHNLFVRNMFIHLKAGEYKKHIPQFTVLHVPHFHATPEYDGTRSDVFIIIHFGKKIVLIGGTSYAGEIKKAVFTVLNFLLPQEKILTMHCSANMGKKGDVALFFGLSGTGKTTLSSDPNRRLIGDDEHGWTEKGIFNLERGCYAKVINLSKDSEPLIYETTRKFGTILENVAIDNLTRKVDLTDASLTENTRASYPLSHIPDAVLEGTAGHPENIIMLTADAFGIMPPVAKLTPAQAQYFFLSGYTSKLAGTETSLGKEPVATFSACFGSPFMALPPPVYSRLLINKIEKHMVKCWMVNTGWIGGPFGVGKRISIEYSRRIIRAIMEGELDDSPMRTDPVFKFKVPLNINGIEPQILNPRDTWAEPSMYDAKAKELACMFYQNFKQFENEVPKEVLLSCPE